MAVVAAVRRSIPLVVRQEVKHYWRRVHDIANGIQFDSCSGKTSSGKTSSSEVISGKVSSQHSVCLVQPIRQSNFYQNKLTNITRGAALLDQSVIRSQKNWSFWHRNRRPNVANGFVAGRNLINGKLVAQTAGGLCQLSSMAYYLALLTGLTVIERHPHSIDIYEEHQRYTPLGSDATVVWGFKDLRLHNPYSFAVSFEFKVEGSELIGRVNAEHMLTAREVKFVRTPLQKPFVKIDTVVNNKIVETTVYQQQQGLQTVSV